MSLETIKLWVDDEIRKNLTRGGVKLGKTKSREVKNPEKA